MRRMSFFLVVMTLSIFPFILSSCRSINQDQFQNVPATSLPTGVNVLVDGMPAGKTPVSLELDRKTVHTVRFEAEGFRPVEIQITQRRPPLVETMLKNAWLIPVGGVVIGTPIDLIWYGITGKYEELGEMGRAMASFAVGGLISWIVGSNLDRNRSANSILEPKTLHVEMERAQAGEAPEVIQIERKNLQSIRWIRISTK